MLQVDTATLAADPRPEACAEPRAARAKTPGEAVWRLRAIRWAGVLLLLLTVAGSGWAGVRLRQWLWTRTAPVRFTGDIQNGFAWGTRILRDAHPSAAHGAITWREFSQAYLGYYDKVVAGNPEGSYQLDYTPLRLLVMSLWVKHVQVAYPNAGAWRDEYTAPLLTLNTACEAVAALAAFLLVRHWLGRTPPALLAAWLIWFNPAVLLDAHAWPQWDVWIVPFFLLAAWLASVDWWLASGAMLAIGCMLKGQLLLVCPLFILWPLFAGRPGAAIRAILGFLLAGELMVLPWLARGPAAWIWLGTLLLAGGIVAPWLFGRRRDWPRGLWWLGAVLYGALVMWPWFGRDYRHWIGAGFALAGAIAIRPWILRRPHRAVWLAALVIAAGVVCATMFHGSWSWYQVGFEYPTRHFLHMTMGPANNLASILEHDFHWQLGDLAATVPAHALWLWPAQPLPLTIKELLAVLYAMTLVLCSVAAARHSRRNDPRILIALCAPWVLFFALLAQMHERYLLWGAAITAIAAAVGFRFLLLHLLVSVLAMGMMAHAMLDTHRQVGRAWWAFLQGAHPGAGWMVLLCASIYLYLALRSRFKTVTLPLCVRPVG